MIQSRVSRRGREGWVPHDERNFGRQQTTHGMADEDHVGIFGLVRAQPRAESIARHLQRLICLVTRVDFGVDHMRIQEQVQVLVNVVGKPLERRVGALESMDVHDEQPALAVRWAHRR